MTSREFFGTQGCKDVNVSIFNENDEMIYKHAYTTFRGAVPILRKVISRAIGDYKENFVYHGEPARVEVFTSPKWNLCKYDVRTKKMVFS